MDLDIILNFNILSNNIFQHGSGYSNYWIPLMADFRLAKSNKHKKEFQDLKLKES